MTSDHLPTEPRNLATRVTEQFLVARSPAELFPELAVAQASLPAKYSDIAAAFAKNLLAVLSTVGMPVTLASASACGSHWQRIHSVERILALRDVEAEAGENRAELEVRRSRVAQQQASKKMHEFTSSVEGRDRIAADSCQFLLESLKSSALTDAALELLLQGEVLAWSALEILARDLFETVVNANPKRVLAILQDPIAKQRLPSKLTLEELADFGFDISSSLGSVLSSQQDFSDVRTIRAVLLPALNSDSNVATTLADKGLWMLCQRRHLIVHRRGIIDGRYIEATGDKLPLGSRLLMTPNELESHIKVVGAAGTALLTAAGIHAS